MHFYILQELKEQAVIRGQEKLLKGFLQSTSLKQDKCRERIIKYRAYQAVLSEHSFTTSNLSMEAKLDKNYSHFALQPYIDKKLEMLNPSYVKNKRNQVKFDKAKREMLDVMKTNLQKLEVSCTRDIEDDELEKVQVYFQRRTSNDDAVEKASAESDAEEPDAKEQCGEGKATNESQASHHSVTSIPAADSEEDDIFPENENQGIRTKQDIASSERHQYAPKDKRDKPLKHSRKSAGIKRREKVAAPAIPVIRENSMQPMNLAEEDFIGKRPVSGTSGASQKDQPRSPGFLGPSRAFP